MWARRMIPNKAPMFAFVTSSVIGNQAVTRDSSTKRTDA
jgi:hypothetical protein